MAPSSERYPSRQRIYYELVAGKARGQILHVSILSAPLRSDLDRHASALGCRMGARQVLRWYPIVVPVLAAAVLVGASMTTGSSTRAAITAAVLAPLEAFEGQNAPALCADLVPAVAAELVPRAPAGSTCEAAVQEAFTSATAVYKPSLAGAKVQDIVVHGDRASAGLVSITTKGKRNFQKVTLHVTSVKLEEIAGRWLLASPALLVEIKGCGMLLIGSGCPANSHVLALAIVSSPEEPPLPAVPAAVRRAGGQELSDFETGRRVYAQSGCAACHRIDKFGNEGPGPNLTRIGSRLSSSKIGEALVDPSAPMPSFRNLPAAKFKAIVEFLSLLRRTPAAN